MGSEDSGPQPPYPSIGRKHASFVQDHTDPVEQGRPVLTTPAASSANFINNPYQLLMYDDDEEEVEEEKELVEIPHTALSVGQHVSFAPTDIRSERVTKRVKHAPRASVPPKRILHRWKEIARVFDTQKKGMDVIVLMRSWCSSLRFVFRNYYGPLYEKIMIFISLSLFK